jgi:hypothetical protein
VTDWVGSIACAKEASWTYEMPDLQAPVATVAISLDGAMLAMKEAGWREAMVGSLSFNDLQGSDSDDPSVEKLSENPFATYAKRRASR